MATAPEKSPVQEFPLSFPKWGPKTKVNHHQRGRRPVESPPRPRVGEYGKRHDRTRSSPSSDGDCNGVARSESENRKLTLGSGIARGRVSFADMMQGQRMSTPERQKEKERLEEGDGERRVRVGVGEGESNAGGVVGEGVEAEAEADESAQKPWNLRPRRAATKSAIDIVAGGGGCGRGKNGELLEVQQMENLPKSMRLRGFAAEGSRTERKEKRRFWISLSKEEIEEDIYALTGSKPARRPRKRARNVQRHLDNIFPGLWLAGVSTEYYLSSRCNN
ncbi:hypothetical protein Dimus_008963 [Dionaea muscipula]